MGAVFYISGILIALLFFIYAAEIWYKKNKDRIMQYWYEWACYELACHRGYINPAEEENDRAALDFAIKHNKKQAWIVYN